jgi:hypothetical protein
LYLKHANESLKRRGLAPIMQKLTKEQIRYIRRKAGATAIKGRVISKARVEALQDPRTSVLATVANRALCKDVLPETILNFDATTFDCTDEDIKIVVTKNCQTNRQNARYIDDSGLTFFIKVQPIMNARGVTGPPMFVVADPNMAEDEMKVFKVPRLSNNMNSGAFGYLILAKTRGENLNVCIWFINNIIIPFAKESTADLPEGSTCTVFHDGCALQVKAIFDPTTRVAMKEIGLRCVKFNASKSLSEQPFDTGDGFKKAKHTIKKKESTLYLDSVLEKNIATLLREKTSIAAARQRKIVASLLKLVATIQVTWTPAILREGFVRSGQLIDPSESNEWEQSAQKKLFNMDGDTQVACGYKWKWNEYEHVVSKLDILEEEFLKSGTIRDEFMDQHQIPKSHNNEKGDLAVHRMRTTILNHSDIESMVEARKLRQAQAEQERIARATERKAFQLIKNYVDKELSKIKKESETQLKDVAAAIVRSKEAKTAVTNSLVSKNIIPSNPQCVNASTLRVELLNAVTELETTKKDLVASRKECANYIKINPTEATISGFDELKVVFNQTVITIVSIIAKVIVGSINLETMGALATTELKRNAQNAEVSQQKNTGTKKTPCKIDKAKVTSMTELPSIRVVNGGEMIEKKSLDTPRVSLDTPRVQSPDNSPTQRSGDKRVSIFAAGTGGDGSSSSSSTGRRSNSTEVVLPRIFKDTPIVKKASPPKNESEDLPPIMDALKFSRRLVKGIQAGKQFTNKPLAEESVHL